MTLTVPSFTIPATTPNPNPSRITDAEWWFWLQVQKLAPTVSEYGGHYARKKGFHSDGQYNLDNYPLNYSIRDGVNKTGPWWLSKSSAFDWTFDDAQHGDFKSIAHFTQLLFKSALDPNDPRLDLILFEFYGNADSDSTVEGYDEFKEQRVSSDPSHLWHLHFSFLRSKCGDFWSMWALVSVLMGASVAEWRATLPTAPKPAPKPTAPKPPASTGLPVYKLGARVLENKTPNMKGTDVLYVQTFCGGSKYFGTLDGVAGDKFEAGVKRYQGIRGLKQDGVVGPKTWAAMGIH